MAATLSRIVFDLSGNEVMIVHPDQDAQLADPAFGPQGSIWADVPRASYAACQTTRDRLVLAQPIIALKNAAVGLAITTKINAIDAAAQVVVGGPLGLNEIVP